MYFQHTPKANVVTLHVAFFCFKGPLGYAHTHTPTHTLCQFQLNKNIIAPNVSACLGYKESRQLQKNMSYDSCFSQTVNTILYIYFTK